MTKPKIFVSSSRESLPVARALKEQLESAADVTIWSDGAFNVANPIFESLTEVADRSDFAVFILSPDDTPSRRESRWSSRQNVFFELGFLSGKLGLSRVLIVETEPRRTFLPSDLAGILYIGLQSSMTPDLRLALAPAAESIRRAIKDIDIRRDQPTDDYSCFVSYSWKDKEFADRLHDDLQEAGVKCWLDAKDMQIGGVLTEQIDRAVQAHDKVLLVLSESSIQSSWVRHELRHALRLEKDRKKTVLFPLALDETVFTVSSAPEFDQLRQRYISDFAHWQEPDRYKRAFSKLVRDLAIRASVEAARAS